MRVRSGLLAVAVCASLGVAGVGADGSAGAAGVPRCATANLRLDFVGGQGFTSHRAWDFGLRNVGPATCHLKGYPGIGLLDAHARPINVSVSRNTGFPVKNVVLHPWQRAFFSFVFVVSGPCIPHFFSAYGLEVFPPNSSSRLVYYAGRFDVCNPSVGGNPIVYPIRAKRALSAADVTVPPGHPPAVSHCSSAQLKLQFVSMQGATGHRLWAFAWRDTGRTCKLRGYPKVALLDKHGHPDTGTVHHGTGFPVKTVTVKHGKRAFFVFQYLDGAFCAHSAQAFRFALTPPGGSLASKFNPTGPNHGTVVFCPGSTVVFPVNSTPAP